MVCKDVGLYVNDPTLYHIEHDIDITGVESHEGYVGNNIINEYYPQPINFTTTLDFSHNLTLIHTPTTNTTFNTINQRELTSYVLKPYFQLDSLYGLRSIQQRANFWGFNITTNAHALFTAKFFNNTLGSQTPGFGPSNVVYNNTRMHIPEYLAIFTTASLYDLVCHTTPFHTRPTVEPITTTRGSINNKTYPVYSDNAFPTATDVVEFTKTAQPSAELYYGKNIEPPGPARDYKYFKPGGMKYHLNTTENEQDDYFIDKVKESVEYSDIISTTL